MTRLEQRYRKLGWPLYADGDRVTRRAQLRSDGPAIPEKHGTVVLARNTWENAYAGGSQTVRYDDGTTALERGCWLRREEVAASSALPASYQREVKEA